MLRQVHISILPIDPEPKNRGLVLKEIDGERTLPIWVGLLDAKTMVDLLEGITFSRIMIHDLIGGIIGAIEDKVNRIVVFDPKDNSYYAIINIVHKGRELSINARPSDTLALSLSAKAPILVSEEVLNKRDQVEWQIEQENDSVASNVSLTAFRSISHTLQLERSSAFR